VADDDAVIEAVSDAAAPTDSVADGDAVILPDCVKPSEVVDVVVGVDGGVATGVPEGLKPGASDEVPEGVRVAVLERVGVLEGVGSV